MFDIPNWVLAAVQVITTVVVGIIGFYMKRDAKKTDRVAEDLPRFKLEVAENYVRKDDYNRNQSEIIRRLDKLQEMLVKALTK